MNTWPPKTPNETLDYQVDWSARLGTDTISSVVWTVPTGLTTTDDSVSGTVATVWLSGRTDATRYSVVCQVTTAAGRVFEETVILPVKSQ